jgi:putative transposase
VIEDGGIYHVLNRRVGRLTLFDTDADYAAFETVIDEVCRAVPMRILAYCLMPNHWHHVLWPVHGKDLSSFMQRLTVTHMRRWHAHHGTAGTGALYQGRFKSFPVENDPHLLTAARYVERNALRARLVRRAERWRWCSLWRRQQRAMPPWLVPASAWPVDLPANWVELVNAPQTAAEHEALRRSVRRGTPFGSDAWQRRVAKRLDLESSLRDPWRPKKVGEVNLTPLYAPDPLICPYMTRPAARSTSRRYAQRIETRQHEGTSGGHG